MKHLGGIGALLALAGLLSIALALFNYNLKVLAWIELWGTGIGWAIRAALVIVGALLFFVAPSASDSETV